jgi:hypothetical protein
VTGTEFKEQGREFNNSPITSLQKPVFRSALVSIRIQIQIQHFRLMWIRIQDFDDQNGDQDPKHCQNSSELDDVHLVLSDMEPWRACRSKVADSHHFDEDPDPHQSEKW